MKLEDMRIGMKVRVLGDSQPTRCPEDSPKVGSIGTIVDLEGGGSQVVRLSFPKGGHCNWWLCENDIEPVAAKSPAPKKPVPFKPVAVAIGHDYGDKASILACKANTRSTLADDLLETTAAHNALVALANKLAKENQKLKAQIKAKYAKEAGK